MNTGDKLHGFTLDRTVPVGELGGSLHSFTHDKTGLQLLFLDRPDDNKTFGVGFKTLPEDSTGVFHILEHSVLCGSDSYPVKEPFVELLKSSMNTFLNALTFPDKTFYPVSSRNDKDFINLMKVYLDAVFHPAIYTNPNIFLQEGWHYEFDEAGNPSYKGVVFNEMKGAFADPDDLMYQGLTAALLPDTPYAYCSGGDPEVIPNLTYEQFLDFHRRFYSPTNGYILLDGSVDLGSVLPVIDGVLGGFDRGEFVPPAPLQKPVDGGIREIPYEVSGEENAENKYRTAWATVIADYSDRETIVAAGVLCDVLAGTNYSPLTKAILRENLAEDVFLTTSSDIPQTMWELEVRNHKAENADRIREVIFGELRRIVKEGVDEETLLATIANMEFKARERDYGGFPTGLVHCFNVLDSFLYGGEPEARLEVGDLFDRLRAKVGTGYFENLIKEKFLENPHRCKVIMVPSASAGDARRERESKRLEREISALTGKDVDALKAKQQALILAQQTPDTKEQLATIPRLQLSDISPRPERYPSEVTVDSGITVLRHNIPTSGIAYVKLLFDARDFTREELSALSFLSGVIGHVGTTELGAEALTNRERLLFGSFNATVNAFARVESPDAAIMFSFSFSALQSNLKEACALALDILTKTDFSNTAAVTDVLKQDVQERSERFVVAGHALAISRTTAMLHKSGVAGDCCDGFAFYEWLKNADKNLSPRDLCNLLAGLLGRIATAGRLTVSITGDADACAAEVAEYFTKKLPLGSAGEPADLPLYDACREGVLIPADICFAIQAGPMDGEHGYYQAVSRIVSLAYLWNAVRVQGGAYGVGLRVQGNGAACYSYRDPDGARSLQCYAQCGSFLRQIAASGEDLTGFIIGAISDASPVLSPRVQGSVEDTRYFTGRTYEMRCRQREELLATSAEDLLKAADAIDACFATAPVCVVGGREKLDKCNLDRILKV